MSDEWLVMSDEWLVMSDEWLVVIASFFKTIIKYKTPSIQGFLSEFLAQRIQDSV